MIDQDSDHSREAADRVLEFAEEVEASGDAATSGDTLEAARAALHDWIDRMTGVVITPALGRVTIIHPGVQSTISSPDLPFEMSTPIGDRAD
jgi:hypothetical protein